MKTTAMETKRLPKQSLGRPSKASGIGVVKAFSYLRVSGKDQIKGDGFPRQRAAIEAYAKAHGLHIVREWRDGGVSGTKEADDRPQWSAMIVELLADGVKVVIIEQVNRLARDLMVQEHAIAALRKAGFTLISTMEPDLMADDPSRKMIRQILGSVAEYQKDELVLKLRAARVRMRAAQGRCEGRKPYGGRAGEQEILQVMRDLRGQGMSYAQVAEELNRRGIPSRYGRGWSYGVVNQILRSQGRG